MKGARTMESWNLKDYYKVLLYGDSISKGVVYDEDKGRYITLGANYVTLAQDNLKVLVQNAAKFGNTILKAITKLPADILRSEPDIVLMEFGGNDCDFNWEEVAKNPSGQHFPKTEFEAFKSTFKEAINSLHEKDIIPILMTLPPIDADKYFKWISQNNAQTAQNILTYLGSVTRIYWWQERYSSAVVTIAQETKTLWIDVRSAFLNHPNFTELLCIDGIHPNEKGHALIAQTITDYLKRDYSFLLKTPELVIE